MRLSWLSFGVTASVLAACGDPNAGKLFADVQYATRCETTRGCAMPIDRDVCGINQGDPCDAARPEAQLSCDVDELSDGSRQLQFSVAQGGGFSLALTAAVFPPGNTSATGSNCTVRVTDGGNTYQGVCGGSSPSEAQPCRVNNVMFFDDEGNPTVEGDIFCQGLENRANPLLSIEITRIGSGPVAEMAPGRFRLVNCNGLEL